MRLPIAGGCPSGLRDLGSRPAGARQWRGLWWEEGGVGRGSLTQTFRRSRGGRRSFLRLNQLAQLGVFFASPVFVEGLLAAVELVSLAGMRYRVVLIV